LESPYSAGAYATAGAQDTTPAPVSLIGILIITHIGLGNCLLECAAHVLGEHPAHAMALTVMPDDDPERLLEHARELVRMLDHGAGVLILTDMFGATPANIARRLLEAGRVEALAGVNLPMLVRALTYRREPLAVVAEKAMSGCIAGALKMEKEEC
jgi:PTS system mannose-specific IIA component